MTDISSAASLQDLPQIVVSLSKTYSDGHESIRHSHRRLQLMFAISGLMIADTGNATWTVPAGHGLIIPPLVPHQTQMIGEVALRSLYISTKFAEDVAAQTCRVVSISPLLAALIERQCALENKSPSEPLAHHLSALILLELGEAPISPLALPYPNHSGLRGICEALRTEPSLIKTIDQWAGEVGMSRRAFTRVFRQQTGLSFDRWRQRLRCQIAMQEIARDQPIEKVATKVGYSSPYSLRAMMRRLAANRVANI